MQIAAEDMQDKKYRKYLYPDIIDGITYEDDTEKKLSESSWFRCLKPAKQVAVEKEMRLRATGAFNHKVLVYRDKDADAAPAIPKPVLERLCESLTGTELKCFMRIIPYIHPNDGLLRNASNRLLNVGDFISLFHRQSPDKIFSLFHVLEQKRLIMSIAEDPASKIRSNNDLFLDLGAVKDMPEGMLKKYIAARKIAIYVNPFVVFLNQYIDAYTVPFFKNSGWYVINPYATAIEEWISKNCR